MNDIKKITVEVAYALPEKQKIIAFEVAEGTTALDAIHRSGILEQFPDIDLEAATYGIFSKPCTADTPLKEYDRVEIYRPLLADPKEIRKRRALEMAEKKKAQAEAKAAEKNA